MDKYPVFWEEQVMEKVDTAIAVSFGLPHDQFV